MGDVVATARRFREQARRRGAPARAQLARRYAKVLAGVRRDTARVERDVAVLRRNGREPSPDVVRALESLQGLRARTQSGLLDAAATVFDVLGVEVRREVLAALADATQLTRAAGASMTARIDETAVLNLAGNVERGPLADLLAERAGADADAVATLLVDGLIRGRDTAKTAQLVAARIDGGSLAAAQRLVRTETHRARREAARVVYGHTPGCLGWVWICSLTPTSCGLCWARHGHVYPLNEPMPTHPNCSCECAPYFGEEVDKGEDLFDALTPAEQDTALGPATAAAYRAGAVTLQGLARTGRHPLWGPVGVQASLSSVLGAAGAARFYVR